MISPALLFPALLPGRNINGGPTTFILIFVFFITGRGLIRRQPINPSRILGADVGCGPNAQLSPSGEDQGAPIRAHDPYYGFVMLEGNGR